MQNAVTKWVLSYLIITYYPKKIQMLRTLFVKKSVFICCISFWYLKTPRAMPWGETTFTVYRMPISKPAVFRCSLRSITFRTPSQNLRFFRCSLRSHNFLRKYLRLQAVYAFPFRNCVRFSRTGLERLSRRPCLWNHTSNHL